jgi:phosphopantetheinyl transferase
MYAGGSIGIDIQRQKNLLRLNSIREYVEFSSNNAGEEQEFFAEWTLREALTKASGSSLLHAHPAEPRLKRACAERGQCIRAGAYVAMVDEVFPGLHLAIVVQKRVETRQCA